MPDRRVRPEMQALVVDDSRAMRMILRRMLAPQGFDVVEAPDGQAALHLLDGGLNPDLMLVDWHMPGMEGIDLVRSVRGSAYDYTGRLMMVTTETEVVQMIRALEAGADEYVMKPFTQEALLEKLQIIGLGA